MAGGTGIGTGGVVPSVTQELKVINNIKIEIGIKKIPITIKIKP